MSKPDRSSKFSYTSPDQIVTGKELERVRAQRRVEDVIRRENLDPGKVVALISENLDRLRPDA